MNAPLSRYLTRFATEARVAPVPPAIEPTVTLAVVDLDARLAEVHANAQAEAERVHESRLGELTDAHHSAVTDAVAAARAEWCAGAANDVGTLVERAFDALHADLSSSIANVLRPLLAEAARERTLAALETVLARLLADPAHPAITVRAPADLVAALRARGLPDGIAFVAADVAEAVVTCGGTRIETRLAVALAAIAKG